MFTILIFVSGSQNSYVMKGANGGWYFTPTSKLSGETALSEQDAANANITVAGTIAADKKGVNLVSNGITFDLAEGGRVSAANFGILSNGADLDLEIAGTVSAGWYPLYLSGARNSVSISGSVEGTGDGSAGLAMHGDGANVEVQAGGIVSGEHAGIALIERIGAHGLISNHGSISGGRFAVVGDDGTEVLVNRGILHGDIDLGGGNDTIDLRHGTHDGNVIGGAGDDVYIFDRSSQKTNEIFGEGYDTVKATVGFTIETSVERLILIGSRDIDGTGNFNDNALFGNRGDNHLSGLGGLDFLDGGRGDDVLTGGLGSDTFHFAKGDGHDVITDFRLDGFDMIELQGWTGISSFRDLKRHHAHDTADGVLIEDGKDSLLISGLEKGELQLQYFVFEN